MNPGTKRFSWLMWIDMDAIVEEMEFEIPVSRYRDVDLVIWGNETELLKHKDAKTGNKPPLTGTIIICDSFLRPCSLRPGLNTGVFLLRNSKWSRNFLAEVTRFGENFFNISGALTEAEQVWPVPHSGPEERARLQTASASLAYWKETLVLSAAPVNADACMWPVASSRLALFHLARVI